MQTYIFTKIFRKNINMSKYVIDKKKSYHVNKHIHFHPTHHLLRPLTEENNSKYSSISFLFTCNFIIQFHLLKATLASVGPSRLSSTKPWNPWLPVNIPFLLVLKHLILCTILSAIFRLPHYSPFFYSSWNYSKDCCLMYPMPAAFRQNWQATDINHSGTLGVC